MQQDDNNLSGKIKKSYNKILYNSYKINKNFIFLIELICNILS